MKKSTTNSFNRKVGALKRSLGKKADQPGALIEAARPKTLSRRDVAIRGLV